MFTNLLQRKRLVYSSIGNTEYYRVVRNLQSAGIKYSIKTNANIRHLGAKINGTDFLQEKFKIYDIYVPTNDEHKAIQIINPQ